MFFLPLKITQTRFELKIWQYVKWGVRINLNPNRRMMELKSFLLLLTHKPPAPEIIILQHHPTPTPETSDTASERTKRNNFIFGYTKAIPMAKRRSGSDGKKFCARRFRVWVVAADAGCRVQQPLFKYRHAIQQEHRHNIREILHPSSRIFIIVFLPYTQRARRTQFMLSWGWMQRPF